MVDKRIYNHLKRASKTYYYNTLFFPESIRDEVFVLYAYVRVGDDLVDQIPQKVEEFMEFKVKTFAAWNGEKSGDIIIDTFIELARKREFELSWIEAFLRAMEADLSKTKYETLAEIEEYVFGSAEVVGLMMARIMGLDHKADIYSRYLGKVQQYVNFIRHIEEDFQLGRNYFPQEDMRKFGLESLEESYLRKNVDKYQAFIKFQADRVQEWQKEAEKGFEYIPADYLVPIRSANKIYQWTCEKVVSDPFVVFADALKKQFNTYFYMLFIVIYFRKVMF